MTPPRETDAAPDAVPAVPLGEAVRAWARIGLESFGGPAGQIAAMHRIVVVEKRWIDERRFLHALNFCMLLPGPEAMQLATYLGWLLHRTVGGLIAGMLFILPGFLAILALSVLYAAAAGTAAAAGLLFGLKAAVIALIAAATLRLARRMLCTAAAAGLAIAAFAAIELLAMPFPIVVLAAGAAGFAASRWMPGGRVALPEADRPPPRLRTLLRPLRAGLPLWLLPTALLLAILGVDSVFTRLALFLSGAAVVSFGGAYAVLAFVAQHAVEREGWLTASQMLDGLALGEATPGPLIQVVQFVAFLAAEGDPGGLSPIVAGVLASLLATWVTFAPSFLFVFVGGPCMEWLRQRARLQAALAGIGAAVVGVIASLGLWFAIATLFGRSATLHAGPLRLRLPELATLDAAALALAAAALLLLRLRWSSLAVLAACGAAGAALRLLEGSPP